MPKLYTMKEVSRILNVPLQTVYSVWMSSPIEFHSVRQRVLLGKPEVDQLAHLLRQRGIL